MYDKWFSRKRFFSLTENLKDEKIKAFLFEYNFSLTLDNELTTAMRCVILWRTMGKEGMCRRREKEALEMGASKSKTDERERKQSEKEARDASDKTS